MFKPKQITRLMHLPTIRNAMAMLTASLTLIVSSAISAQETDQSEVAPDDIEEIVIFGTRGTVQRSIDLKRNATQIVDGLSADEIGDIPALSIGAALETITGATSHRENGCTAPGNGLMPMCPTNFCPRSARNQGASRPGPVILASSDAETVAIVLLRINHDVFGGCLFVILWRIIPHWSYQISRSFALFGPTNEKKTGPRDRRAQQADKNHTTQMGDTNYAYQPRPDPIAFHNGE